MTTMVPYTGGRAELPIIPVSASDLPFSPKSGGAGTGQTLAVSAASASVAVDAAYPQIRIWNIGSVAARVRFTVGASTALTADMALPPGAVEVFTKGAADTLSAITASGTTTLEITVGGGA